MGFSGCIEDLPVVDLFQYLSVGKKDGTCIFVRKDEKAYVYFHKGNVVHALAPQRTNLGDILIKANQLDLKSLQKALVAQSGEEKGKTIGQILVGLGAISPEHLKVAIQLQLKETIQSLVTWQVGDFTFENNEIIPVDDINLNPAEVIPQSRNFSTTQLLMEALSALDESPEISEKPGEGLKVPVSLEEKDLNLTEGLDALGESMGAPEKSVEDLKMAGPSEDVESALGTSGVPVSPESGNGTGAVSEAEKTESAALAPAVLHAKKEKNLIILLVGDGVFKNLLREGLQDRGYSVVGSSSVEDSLEKGREYIKKGEFPIFLTDHQISGRTRRRVFPGIRFLREREKSGGRFEVIVMTDGDEQEVTMDLYQEGAKVVIPKPSRGPGGSTDFPASVKKFCGVVQTLIQNLLPAPSIH